MAEKSLQRFLICFGNGGTMTNKLKNEFVIWLAGFIDGDGCIGIRNGGPTSKYGRIRMHITNTDKKVLEYIKQEVGYGYVYTGNSSDGIRKTTYVYEVAARQAERLIRQLIPYFQIKSEQAKLALEFQATMRGRNNVPDSLYEARSIIRDKIKVLNKKGVA